MAPAFFQCKVAHLEGCLSPHVLVCLLKNREMNSADMTVSCDWYFPLLLEFSLFFCMCFFSSHKCAQDHTHTNLPIKGTKYYVLVLPPLALTYSIYTCVHTHPHKIIFCLVCAFASIQNPCHPPAPNSKPLPVSQGAETQTRVHRAISTPQPLNTFSALPFENKPRRQAPCI